MVRSLRSVLALLLCLQMALWGWPAPAPALTLEEERKLGREAYEEVLAQVPLVKDPDCLAYLRGLGRRITDLLHDEPFTYTFNIADSGEMNAFAIPGGYIFFFRGIITMLESEGELAGVLAHEIAHIHHRHLANRLERSTPVGIATLAGMLAGMVLAALTGGAALGSALMIGSVAGGVQAQLGFSREDESQSDYTGYKLMTSLGYPGRDMAQSFGRIWRMERLLGSANVPAYLRSHPTSPERAERIEDMVRRRATPAQPYDNREFTRIKTRLIALYESEEQARQAFTRQRVADPEDPLAVYGLALMEMRGKRYQHALDLWGLLKRRWWRDNPLVAREEGKCLLLMGQAAQARRLLTPVALLRPTDAEALSLLAQAQLAEEQLEAARDTLAGLVNLEPENDQAHYDLGVTLGRMGQTAESSLHLGRAFLMRGNERSARFHLTKAVAGLEGRPQLQAQAEKALEELDERSKEWDKKRKEEEKRRREQDRREEDDRRGSGRPPWEPGRP